MVTLHRIAPTLLALTLLAGGGGIFFFEPPPQPDLHFFLSFHTFPGDFGSCFFARCFLFFSLSLALYASLNTGSFSHEAGPSLLFNLLRNTSASFSAWCRRGSAHIALRQIWDRSLLVSLSGSWGATTFFVLNFIFLLSIIRK